MLKVALSTIKRNGSHFVPIESKFLLIALIIVRITLNVIVRQMPLNVR